MKLKISAVVTHPVYGIGVVMDAWLSRKGAENYAVKFVKGGPLGFAEHATNDVDQLTVVTENSL